jgi:hypothetical protein
MFKTLALVLLAAALAPTSGAWPLDPRGGPDYIVEPERRLDLVFVDVERAVPFAFKGLAQEVSSILGREGVGVRWRQGGRGVVAQERELTVVLLNNRGGGSITPSTMGATRVDDGVVHTVWVFLPNVANVLGFDRRDPSQWNGQERAAFGTAVGRVIAHEIFHALVPDLPHSAHGLMAERLGRGALVGPWVDLPASFRVALRPALLRRASLDD